MSATGSLSRAAILSQLPVRNQFFLFISVSAHHSSVKPTHFVSYETYLLCLQCHISSIILEQLLCTSPQTARHGSDCRNSKDC